MMIEGFGYTITDSIKLLGVNVSNKLDNTHEIYGELITKLRSLVNFWNRFKLTLPGRLTIMKTLLKMNASL